MILLNLCRMRSYRNQVYDQPLCIRLDRNIFRESEPEQQHPRGQAHNVGECICLLSAVRLFFYCQMYSCTRTYLYCTIQDALCGRHQHPDQRVRRCRLENWMFSAGACCRSPTLHHSFTHHQQPTANPAPKGRSGGVESRGIQFVAGKSSRLSLQL